MNITLIVSLSPSKTMRDLSVDPFVESTYMNNNVGKFVDGNMFKVVHPMDIPDGVSSRSHVLLGIRLRCVRVLRGSALSHNQKEWLLSRRHAILKTEFISKGSIPWR